MDTIHTIYLHLPSFAAGAFLTACAATITLLLVNKK